MVVGAGIFTLGAKVAATKAGPSVTIGFVLAAFACGLAAMCYAEFASTVPVAGSAYTFSYATLGEFVAWIIGWDLMLELALGAAVVARGWSAYLGNLFYGRRHAVLGTRTDGPALGKAQDELRAVRDAAGGRPPEA